MNERTTRRASRAVLLLGLCLGLDAGAGDRLAQEIHPLFLDQPGTIALPKSLARPGEIVVTIHGSETDSGDGCGPDCFLLTAGIANAEAREAFHTANGRPMLYLADLDGDRLEEIVLVLGEAQETGAQQEHLLVLRVRDGKFQRLLDLPVSESYGGEARWRYALRFDNEPAGAGTRTALDLTLANDRSTAGGMAASRQLVTRKQHQRLAWDAGRQEFVETGR